MDIDVRGRVRNTPVPASQGLLPLFEAVANSVHAIEDSGRVHDGLVEVRVTRDRGLFEEEPPSTWPVVGYDIMDDGIGFNTSNWDSFNKADSMLKSDRGGRGLGRFVWLKVFRYALVRSGFDGPGGRHERTFSFKQTEKGVEDHEVERCECDLGTTVTLVGVDPEYGPSLPRNSHRLAERLVEHFLSQFVLRQMPRVVVVDAAVGERHDLNVVFEELVGQTDTDVFEVGSSRFELTHFLLTPGKRVNSEVSLCADGRKVAEWKNLHHEIKDLKGSLSRAVEYAEGTDSWDEALAPFREVPDVYYAGYLVSRYLDRIVDPSTRSAFRFPSKDGAGLFGAGPTEADIRSATVPLVREFLSPFLNPLRNATRTRVEEMVTQDMPEYRGVLAHRPQVLEQIGVSDSEASIERQLHEAHLDVRQEALDTIKEIQEADAETLASGKFDRFADLWNDVGKADLARYVIHRRHTLDVLDTYLRAPEDKKRAIEEQVHSLIFPVRATSHDMTPDSQNLWLIDERLAFHRYLASDKSVQSIDVVDSESSRRPDLAVFDQRVAVVGEDDGPYSAVSIFEFKRPGRNDYAREEGKDPLAQLFDYVDLFKERGATTDDDRKIAVTDRTRFYLYLVADIEDRLRKVAERNGMTVTADGEGFYDFNSSLNAYVEIIGWDKLLRDAEKRNRVLFHKLGMPRYAG